MIFATVTSFFVVFFAFSNAFQFKASRVRREHQFKMVAISEPGKKLGKVEAIKVNSNYLKDPLRVISLKYHEIGMA